MTIWFTSDQHYGHTNIIKYSGRPYVNVEVMNMALTRNFNACVKPEDITFHVGDFALDEKYVAMVLPALNGTHHLVMGNHDHCSPLHKKGRKLTYRLKATRRYLSYGFTTVQGSCHVDEFVLAHIPHYDLADSRFDGQRPIVEPNKVQLCGHVHERWKYRPGMVNVGVDQWGYKPVSLDSIRGFLLSRNALLNRS